MAEGGVEDAVQAVVFDLDGVLLESEGVWGAAKRELTQQLPVMPGADDAVRRLAARWPLGLASASDREIIDLVGVEDAGLLQTVFEADLAAFAGQSPELASRYRTAAGDGR